MPCYKLGLRFGRDDISNGFWRVGRMGLHAAVGQQGMVEAGFFFTPLEP